MAGSTARAGTFTFSTASDASGLYSDFWKNCPVGGGGARVAGTAGQCVGSTEVSRAALRPSGSEFQYSVPGSTIFTREHACRHWSGFEKPLVNTSAHCVLLGSLTKLSQVGLVELLVQGVDTYAVCPRQVPHGGIAPRGDHSDRRLVVLVEVTRNTGVSGQHSPKVQSR